MLQGERELDDERQGLVRQQFELYASELPWENPYGDAPDNLTVERARAFLRENANEQSFYAAMLSQANSQFASVQLNRDYPVVLGTLYFFTIIGLVSRLLSDLSYIWFDPRISFERLS